MILINFNLNNKNVSKMVGLDISAKELLESIYYSSKKLSIGHKDHFSFILLDSKPSYADSVPAFMLNGRNIYTIDGIKHTKIYENTLKVLQDEELGFCESCFSTNILLFYYFVKSKIIKKSDILSYYNIMKCNCIDILSFLNIYSNVEDFEKNDE